MRLSAGSTLGPYEILHVRKEDAAIAIEAFGASPERMIAVARKALARLR